jgi:hypothetical protein
MQQFEYKIIAAPSKGQRIKGLKTTVDRFAYGLTEALNQMAAEGWEYLRAETLPCDERRGLTGTKQVMQNLLVFRRELAPAAQTPLTFAQEAYAPEPYQPAPEPYFEPRLTPEPYYEPRLEPEQNYEPRQAPEPTYSGAAESYAQHRNTPVADPRSLTPHAPLGIAPRLTAHRNAPVGGFAAQRERLEAAPQPKQPPLPAEQYASAEDTENLWQEGAQDTQDPRRDA